ncbi:unnamed protein product [Ectocarpus sp. 12 AP-2014]
MKYIYKILCFIALFFPLIALATPNSASVSELSPNEFDAKAAVVDVESILEHSKAIMHIKKSIHVISEQIQSELSAKEIKLKQAEAELIEKRGVLPKEEFDKLVADFNKRVSSTQQEMQNKKSALERAHGNAITQVHEKTISVISDLSKKYGFNIVFPSSQVLFVNNSLNITHEVISNLNERLQEVKVDYDPAIDNKKD